MARRRRRRPTPTSCCCCLLDDGLLQSDLAPPIVGPPPAAYLGARLAALGQHDAARALDDAAAALATSTSPAAGRRWPRSPGAAATPPARRARPPARDAARPWSAPRWSAPPAWCRCWCACRRRWPRPPAERFAQPALADAPRRRHRGLRRGRVPRRRARHRRLRRRVRADDDDEAPERGARRGPRTRRSWPSSSTRSRPPRPRGAVRGGAGSGRADRRPARLPRARACRAAPSFSSRPCRAPAAAHAAGTGWLLGLHAPAGASFGRFAHAMGARRWRRWPSWPRPSGGRARRRDPRRRRVHPLRRAGRAGRAPAHPAPHAGPHPLDDADTDIDGARSGAPRRPRAGGRSAAPAALALRARGDAGAGRRAGRPPSPLARCARRPPPPASPACWSGGASSGSTRPGRCRWGRSPSWRSCRASPLTASSSRRPAGASPRRRARADRVRAGGGPPRVPRFVQVGEGDELLPVDLAAPGRRRRPGGARARVRDLAAARRRARRSRRTPAGSRGHAGRARAGDTASPLRRSAAVRAAGAVPPPHRAPARADWRRSSCSAPPARQGALLAPPRTLVRAGRPPREIDRWFFLPYVDGPGRRQHLRLRVHALGDAATFARRLRARLHDARADGDVTGWRSTTTTPSAAASATTSWTPRPRSSKPTASSPARSRRARRRPTRRACSCARSTRWRPGWRWTSPPARRSRASAGAPPRRGAADDDDRAPPRPISLRRPRAARRAAGRGAAGPGDAATPPRSPTTGRASPAARTSRADGAPACSRRCSTSPRSAAWPRPRPANGWRTPSGSGRWRGCAGGAARGGGRGVDIGARWSRCSRPPTTPAQVTRLSLPFDGIWGVIQGFDSGETHAGYAAYALDFVPAQPKETKPPPKGRRSRRSPATGGRSWRPPTASSSASTATPATGPPFTRGPTAGTSSSSSTRRPSSASFATWPPAR